MESHGRTQRIYTYWHHKNDLWNSKDACGTDNKCRLSDFEHGMVVGAILGVSEMFPCPEKTFKEQKFSDQKCLVDWLELKEGNWI